MAGGGSVVNIVLIYPNMGDYRTKDAMTPLAIGILAALSPGHRLTFYDDRLEKIPDSLPDADLIAISVETFTARRSYQLADKFRQQGKRVALGGCHITFMPDEAANHADTLLLGDAEGAWEQMLADAERGRLRSCYQGDHTRPLTEYKLDRQIFTGKRYAPISLVQYSRGCRFACDFCSIHAFYPGGVRTRPAVQVREEIRSLPANRFILFVDDNLFSGRRSLNDFLQMLAPLKRCWGCQISIDIARDESMLDALAQAGCGFVLIGFESLNSANLRQMGKSWNHSAGDYAAVVAALHQRGIGVYGTFIFGYDGDTPDTIAQCLHFAQENRLEVANFNLLNPTPGTALYDRLKSQGRLLSPHWWIDPDYRYGDPVFTPGGMSTEQLTELCFQTKTRFYRFGSVIRRLCRFSPRRRWRTLWVAWLVNIVSHREIARKQGKQPGGKA
ncbi:B12-binding domain-containing radical SAM protein [Morganella psychrotolerans]|uniref:B12-binding domain-containing radical SAM protein n=1 Tax=Morganella psychrotolerans TaxID=368603 RepID=UPI001CC2B371|nr:radical SAM protein [Morganella psychrotolerans]